MILAWSICETESGDTYTFFAHWCHEAGLSRYMNVDCIIFSDRQKGIAKFHVNFRAREGKCCQHIIGNARKNIRGTGTTFEDELAWCLRKANTRALYEFWLAKIEAVCPAAAHYFDQKVGPHELVYQYKLNELKIATHGHKTSNIVECVNGVFVEARKQAPYRLNDEVLKWSGGKLKERADKMDKWIQDGHILTPYCHDLWLQQV